MTWFLCFVVAVAVRFGKQRERLGKPLPLPPIDVDAASLTQDRRCVSGRSGYSRARTTTVVLARCAEARFDCQREISGMKSKRGSDAVPAPSDIDRQDGVRPQKVR